MTEVVNSGAENTGGEVQQTQTQETVQTQVETNKAETVLNQAETKTEQPWISNDWREKLAGGDAKELARLQRFTDVNQVYKSYRELEGRVSSGALKQEVDTSKFNDEQLAQWRQANGIPAKAEDYIVDLPDGMVFSEEDQAVLGSVLEEAHRQNRKPAEISALVNAMLAGREAQYAARVEQAKYERTQAEEQLRQQWHGETYLTNIAAIKNMLAAAPDGLGDAIAQAKLPDGSYMGTNPKALTWLANMALELNPAGTVVPGVGADQLKSVQDERAELEALMSKDINAWRKNESGRARHRELIDAELKLKARGY